MHTVGVVLLSVAASFWVLHGLRATYGATRLPWLRDFEPAQSTECPPLSLIFAARNEERKLSAALATLALLEYPQLEIIAVNDRSQDATGRILDEFATSHGRFRALHVSELPNGWLGKTHALQTGYEASSGEWLLFTDADVQLQPDVLRRALTLAEQKRLDHLTLLCNVEMHGFWEKTLITFFALAFHLATNAYRASDPRSRAYVGVGAFQLLRRGAYEAMGTHRRLAMEVVDDMKLGKLMKQAGFRSGAAVAQEFVTVRWQEGPRNIIRGVTKNFFAAFDYQLTIAAAAVAGLLLMNVAPFIGVLAGHGWMRILSAVAVAIALFVHASVALVTKVSPLYALTQPIGAVALAYTVVRSVVVTLWQGGVTWRGTFYPLDELKRGAV